jgi:hypothetical protein
MAQGDPTQSEELGKQDQWKNVSGPSAPLTPKSNLSGRSGGAGPHQPWWFVMLEILGFIPFAIVCLILLAPFVAILFSPLILIEHYYPKPSYTKLFWLSVAEIVYILILLAFKKIEPKIDRALSELEPEDEEFDDEEDLIDDP